MMRRASIAAVERHDAFGCVLTRWLRYSRADTAARDVPGTRTARTLSWGLLPFLCVLDFFLRLVSHVNPLKIRGGGGPAADL